VTVPGVSLLSRVPEGLLIAKVTVDVHKTSRATLFSKLCITQLKTTPVDDSEIAYRSERLHSVLL